MKKPLRAALHNLGCKVNAYETEAMQQMLLDAGYEIVAFNEIADVYVINTCSVTNIADRKSRQMIHRARKQNPEAIVVAAGCYVQTRKEQASLDDAIDIIIGNNQKGELVALLRQMEEKKAQKLSAWTDINDGQQAFEELWVSAGEHTRAFIKVQDGCNQFCSYCIIPYARGRVRSRARHEVLAEVNRLAENGYQEVVLTGIHLSSYGTDCGDNLLSLIQEIHKVDRIVRIRLGSLEPKIVTEEFVRALSALPKVCPHFHLSLQSGCDETLARMNRRYTTAEYERGCGLLRAYFDHPAITTDVIVGFPGETREEFARTVDFVSRIRFYEMHIFKYSRRQHTRAAKMENQVAEEIKARRSGELIALAGRMSEEFREYYRGKRKEVLFEEKQEILGKARYVGYTREYMKVAAESERNLENTVVRGRIGSVLEDGIYSLIPD